MDMRHSPHKSLGASEGDHELGQESGTVRGRVVPRHIDLNSLQAYASAVAREFDALRPQEAWIHDHGGPDSGSGHGSNTAICCIVNAVLLRSRPYRDPGRLVRIFSSVDAQPPEFGLEE